MRRQNLHQRDGGGDGRDEDEQIEDHAEDAADSAHVVEHVLQRGEEQAGAVELDIADRFAAGDAVGDGRGDDRDAGQQRDERIGKYDDAGVLDQVLFLAEVGAVGDHGAHGQRQ